MRFGAMVRNWFMRERLHLPEIKRYPLGLSFSGMSNNFTSFFQIMLKISLLFFLLECYLLFLNPLLSCDLMKSFIVNRQSLSRLCRLPSLGQIKAPFLILYSTIHDFSLKFSFSVIESGLFRLKNLFQFFVLPLHIICLVNLFDFLNFCLLKITW